jgi:hypothetical protein
LRTRATTTTTTTTAAAMRTGPDASALRVLLLAELVSAAGFERDRLYLEWQLHYDPQLWVLQHSEQEVVQPGMLQGVTHVSRMVQYPRDPSTDTSALWVAHFAHPIEVEWVARTPPAPKDWPRLFLQVGTSVAACAWQQALPGAAQQHACTAAANRRACLHRCARAPRAQVCTHDLWNRGTTEGYGWLQLGPASTSGSSTHYVDTWRPLGALACGVRLCVGCGPCPPTRSRAQHNLRGRTASRGRTPPAALAHPTRAPGTRRDQQRAFFVGGSEELQELASCAAPKDHQSRVLNKYGFKTQTGGNLKVCVVRADLVFGGGRSGRWPQRRTLTVGCRMLGARARGTGAHPHGAADGRGGRGVAAQDGSSTWRGSSCSSRAAAPRPQSCRRAGARSLPPAGDRGVQQHGIIAVVAAALAPGSRAHKHACMHACVPLTHTTLQEARGGDVVVREGLLVQPPVVTQQPEDLTVNEGSDVQLCVRAVVSAQPRARMRARVRASLSVGRSLLSVRPSRRAQQRMPAPAHQGRLPRRYQWFREGKRLTVATSNAPLLVLVDVAAADSGAYHCQVTNKDGSAASCKALLTVLRVGRLAAAAASASGAASVAGSPQPVSAGQRQGSRGT